MVKPNHNFELTVNDISLIEDSLNGKIHRRAMSVAMDPTSIYSKSMKKEITEIRDLLGRIHNQKEWYAPANGSLGG
jgi:hypothetical protein